MRKPKENETLHGITAFARRHQARTVDLIRQFVECESPSDNPGAVNRFVDLLAETLRAFGRVRTFASRDYGKHLRCEISFPAGRSGHSRKKLEQNKPGRILALGHSDTVWPLGTIRTMPFKRSNGRLWGPGVFDMKAGLALFIAAVQSIRELELPVGREVMLQVNSDEEIGSPSSRELTEDAARQSAAVLVLEPASGLDGKLKTARKGVGEYTIFVRGVPTHAGLDFEKGASAILEMARQIEVIASFTRLDRGITVSPGVIQGGSRSNVVASECRLEVDVRAPRAADARYIERKFASLKPFDQRCTIEVTGGMNRPPLERTAGVRNLLALAQGVAADLNFDLGETAVGGGSDGNFTGALGIPTLDGLGAVGEGAHAANESILIGRLADRTALLAGLILAIQ